MKLDQNVDSSVPFRRILSSAQAIFFAGMELAEIGFRGLRLPTLTAASSKEVVLLKNHTDLSPLASKCSASCFLMRSLLQFSGTLSLAGCGALVPLLTKGKIL